LQLAADGAPASREYLPSGHARQTPSIVEPDAPT
jgi:hypothetical protein